MATPDRIERFRLEALPWAVSGCDRINRQLSTSASRQLRHSDTHAANGSCCPLRKCPRLFGNCIFVEACPTSLLVFGGCGQLEYHRSAYRFQRGRSLRQSRHQPFSPGVESPVLAQAAILPDGSIPDRHQLTANSGGRAWVDRRDGSQIEN